MLLAEHGRRDPRGAAQLPLRRQGWIGSDAPCGAARGRLQRRMRVLTFGANTRVFPPGNAGRGRKEFLIFVSIGPGEETEDKEKAECEHQNGARTAAQAVHGAPGWWVAGTS